MTDEPDPRMAVLIDELRRNLRNIEDACSQVGVDPAPYLNPSPFWNTDSLRPFKPTKGFPSIEQMLRDIQKAGDQSLDAAGLDVRFKIQAALYAQYRVLSQLTHTSVLGMTATMQYAENGSVSVATRLPKELLALVLQCSAASVFNVARHTVHTFVDDRDGAEAMVDWVLQAASMVDQIAELAGPIHGLTTF